MVDETQIASQKTIMSTIHEFLQRMIQMLLPPPMDRDTVVRLLTLASSCLVMSAAGSLYAFSIFSDGLRERLGFTSSDVNVISAVGNTALYLSFLVIGPFFDRCGVRATLVMGTVSYTSGYALMWAAYNGRLGTPSVVVMAIAYFFAGFGSTAAYMATIGVNVVNFPPKLTGLATGILLLFYGISGTIYSQIFSAWYSGDSGSNVSGYLLFLTVSVAIVNGIGCFTIFSVPTTKSAVPPDTVQVGDPRPSSRVSEPNKDETSVDVPDTRRSSTRTTNHPNDTTADVSMSPISILKSPYLWLYAMVCIWQQGLTFVTNVTTILQAISASDTSTVSLAKQGSMHVTVISIGQSIGRFSFGVLSDIVVGRFKAERSTLLILSQSLLILPHALLSFLRTDQLAAQSCAVLYVCSAFVGVGMGGAGALFPPLTRDLFGTRFYGTACAFLMMGVPLGILVSNITFGQLYDTALSSQNMDGSSSVICRGTVCFSNAFLIMMSIQVIPVVLSVVLFVVRTRDAQKRLARIEQIQMVDSQ